MAILETAKMAVELVRKLDNLEVLQQVVDLRSQIVELFDQNLQLKEQIKHLKARSAIKKKLVFKEGDYYLERMSDKP